MEELICREGTVHSVIFQNAENGYTVLRLLTEEGEIVTVVGCIPCVARSLGVSDGHLSHVFKKETSYTLSAYLTNYRMHKATELLRDCRVKVYEVAESVGYRDIAYFSSAFKKSVGMSPSEYQKRCQ